MTARYRLRRNRVTPAVMVALAALFFSTPVQALPSYTEVRSSYKRTEGVLLDRHGETIHELRLDRKGRRIDWISLKEISPALVSAVIQSEDKRFHEHRGVDWRAAASAAAGNVFRSAKRGASTISMQLVSILDRGLKPRGGRRSLGQKWNQMDAALKLERSWSKDQILEAYLNLVTFRGELQGIASASRGLFSKSPGGLDEKEALILASLIRSPNAVVTDVAKRACDLGEVMNAAPGCLEIERLAAARLSVPYNITRSVSLAPQAARKLLKNTGVQTLSTIDAGLQRLATDLIRYQLSELGKQNVNDGAVLVVDNASGDILAYVGSGRKGQHVDGIEAKRQAGSTLKPFLYELAIERGLLTAASMLDDSPVNIPTARGLYVPRNYDNDYKGPVSVRTALSSSLNIPAVRTLVMTGVEPFLDRLRELGFDLRDPAEHYGYSLALGTADVTLRELVNAYRSLANKGMHDEIRFSFEKKKTGRRVMGLDATYIISDILSDRGARSITFGLENVLSTSYWTAVKTGTSKDMRDNWCIGFSRRYTAGVWVGNFSGEPMWNVSGVSGAAPVWLDVMNYLHRGSAAAAPTASSGVIEATVNLSARGEGIRRELFLRGTEPVSDTAENGARTEVYHVIPRISYPAEGTVIAVDPDIPESNQAVLFSVRDLSGSERLFLDGGGAWKADEAPPWPPQPGRHTLTLTDSSNAVIDTVHFEVRGMTVISEGI